jgi:chromate transporter
MIYFQLFWEFFKTGLFAVGGGLATLPFLSAMATKTGWFTQGQLADMVAVAESTPGPIGVNTATYVGFTTTGLLGGLIATLGLVTPSIIIILCIAAFLKAFQDNRFVVSVFKYLRPASVGLIVAAGISVALIALFNTDAATLLGKINWKAWIMVAILIIFTRYVKVTKKWHPIIFIGISALAGILFF